MANVAWHKVRFLESSGNLKPLIKARTGKTPSTSLAKEIGACLQQGRFFYEAATTSPLEIRPLLLFYGMVGFAKALVVSRTLRSLSQLRHSHGLTDISDQKCRLRDLRIKVGNEGTFQEFNDVISPLSRICYHGRSMRPTAEYLPSASSLQLSGLEMSLKEILSRIPGLEDLYRITFQEEPNTATMTFSFNAHRSEYFELRIDDPSYFSDRVSLRALVQKWRTRYPFLRQWHFFTAVHAWGNSILLFANLKCDGVDEFSEEQLVEEDNRFDRKRRPDQDNDTPRLALSSILQPLGGGYRVVPSAIAPINGLYLSEFSLQYLALYLLASLVRYRPDTWSHAISRTVLADKPADDEMLALLEHFLDVNANDIPYLVVQVMNPHEDRYA